MVNINSIPFDTICGLHNKKVLVYAPSIPDIHNRVVVCDGARKCDEYRYIVLDNDEYSQILFIDGAIELCMVNDNE